MSVLKYTGSSGVDGANGPTGVTGYTGSSSVDGRIGVIRLYNAALTSADVLQNYTATKSIYGL